MPMIFTITGTSRRPSAAVASRPARLAMTFCLKWLKRGLTDAAQPGVGPVRDFAGQRTFVEGAGRALEHELGMRRGELGGGGGGIGPGPGRPAAGGDQPVARG